MGFDGYRFVGIVTAEGESRESHGDFPYRSVLNRSLLLQAPPPHEWGGVVLRVK